MADLPQRSLRPRNIDPILTSVSSVEDDMKRKQFQGIEDEQVIELS